MSVKIHGKDYKTVAERVNDFRNKYGDAGCIQTDLLQHDDVIVMKATISLTSFVIDMEREIEISHVAEHRILGEGHAEEKRGSTQINTTSALENCETSAIGRALAAAGFGGTEYASANEVQNAIHQQNDSANQKKKPGEITFYKGQYKDETVEWAWEHDPAYVDNISHSNANDAVVTACKNFIISKAEEHTAAMAALTAKKAQKAKEKQA